VAEQSLWLVPCGRENERRETLLGGWSDGAKTRAFQANGLKSPVCCGKSRWCAQGGSASHWHRRTRLLQGMCNKEMQNALSGHNVVEGKDFKSTA